MYPFPQPQDTGVLIDTPRTLEFRPRISAGRRSSLSPPASLQASPYPQDPQPPYLAAGQAPGAAWGRPGGAEGWPHRPPGQAGLGGARVRWRSVLRAHRGLADLETRGPRWQAGAVSAEPRPHSPRPLGPAQRRPLPPLRWSGVPSQGLPSRAGVQSSHPTAAPGVRRPPEREPRSRSFPTPRGEHRRLQAPSGGTGALVPQENPVFQRPAAPRHKAGTVHPSPP